MANETGDIALQFCGFFKKSISSSYKKSIAKYLELLKSEVTLGEIRVEDLAWGQAGCWN